MRLIDSVSVVSVGMVIVGSEIQVLWALKHARARKELNVNVDKDNDYAISTKCVENGQCYVLSCQAVKQEETVNLAAGVRKRVNSSKN